MICETCSYPCKGKIHRHCFLYRVGEIDYNTWKRIVEKEEELNVSQ